MRGRSACIALTACVLFVGGPPARGAGHYKLAWWRQIGNYENGAGAGCVGNHVMNVWVFDESGYPKGQVTIRTTWGTVLALTGYDGRAQIIIDNNNTRYDMVCADASGSTSEVAFEMSSRIRPCWGHYSFEIGFLYKTDASNPGSFDTGLNCTLNPGCADYGVCPETFDAPYTRSLAFNSINCADYLSDEAVLGQWQAANSYFGQTFVATGNRVFAIRAHGTIGGNDKMAFRAQIVSWPDMQPVGPSRITPIQFPFGWVIAWGVDDVPVVPGRTYMLKIWREISGMNSYRVVHNNYAQGQYYEGTTAFPGYELEAWVCCMDAGNPKVNILSGPTVTNIRHSSVTVTWDTDVASDSRVDYGLTSGYGLAVFNSTPLVRHSITLGGLIAQSTYHYQVTSAASGYDPGLSGDLTFTTAEARPAGDFNQDLDVDIEDFSHLQECLSGPNIPPADAGCTDADLDWDADVDGDDVAIFLGCLSGPGNPAYPLCGP